MNFTNYYETNGYWKYPMEFVKNVYDPADNKKTYSAYTSMDNAGIIAKGTLENVLNAKIGDIETLLYNINRGSGV